VPDEPFDDAGSGAVVVGAAAFALGCVGTGVPAGFVPGLPVLFAGLGLADLAVLPPDGVEVDGRDAAASVPVGSDSGRPPDPEVEGRGGESAVSTGIAP
jgi:hypothetical protein